MHEDKKYWLGFSMFPGIGPKKVRLLLDTFGSIDNAWNAEQKALDEVIGPTTSSKFVVFRKDFNYTFHLERLIKNDIRLLTYNDVEYPQKLKKLSNAPFLLYIKGNIQILQHPSVAVVGTRKITQYGTAVTSKITHALVLHGLCIVSGLAYGVDAVAHKTTIENEGKTVAVLGCGVDCCYPRANQKIYDDIITSGGVVISEFPMGMTPSVGSFPSRNRIIAGLSDAVIVTEGTQDSGALYTAEEAFLLGRKVFAVPGPIMSDLSKGPFALVKKGGLLVTDIEYILKELEVEMKQFEKSRVKGDSDEETEVITLLQQEDLSFDDIVRKIRKEPARVGVLLSLMEMKGILKSTDNSLFTLL